MSHVTIMTTSSTLVHFINGRKISAMSPQQLLSVNKIIPNVPDMHTDSVEFEDNNRAEY